MYYTCCICLNHIPKNECCVKFTCCNTHAHILCANTNMTIFKKKNKNRWNCPICSSIFLHQYDNALKNSSALYTIYEE